MEKILALYDSDVLYATRFIEFFNLKNEVNFEITAFTRRESLEEFLRFNFIEILLLGEQVAIEEIPCHNIKYIYQLSDKPQNDNGLPHVIKYQSVKVIMNEIISDYDEKENITRINYNPKQTKIVSIFSPVTGNEKISFARSLSLLLSEQDKTLFVILDLLPPPTLPEIDNKGQCLTEFIYYLKENSSIAKMRTLLGTSGKLLYLSGIIHGADVLALNKEDMQQWIEDLRATMEFKTVVFYLGCYTEAMIELMNLSDTVLITSLDNSYETAVLSEWERQMNQLGINIKQEKFQLISLQGQEDLGHWPLTLQELMSSESWAEALQYLNNCPIGGKI